MYHQQDSTKSSSVVLDVIPPHYNLHHHGQPSPPQSPNTTQCIKGKIIYNIIFLLHFAQLFSFLQMHQFSIRFKIYKEENNWMLGQTVWGKAAFSLISRQKSYFGRVMYIDIHTICIPMQNNKSIIFFRKTKLGICLSAQNSVGNPRPSFSKLEIGRYFDVSIIKILISYCVQ